MVSTQNTIDIIDIADDTETPLGQGQGQGFSKSAASLVSKSNRKSKKPSVINVIMEEKENENLPFTKIKMKDSSPLFLRGLLKDDFFDTKLVCPDGIMMVHRLMLWTVSPYFGFMFDDQLPGEMAVVHLPDFSAQTIKILVRFMYRGELRLPDDPEKYEEVQSAMKTLGWIKMDTIRNLNNNEDSPLPKALIDEVSESVNEMIQTIESDENSAQNIQKEPATIEENSPACNLDQVQNLKSKKILLISDKSVQCDPTVEQMAQKEMPDLDIRQENETEKFKSKSTQYEPEDFAEPEIEIDTFQEPSFHGKEFANNLRDIECQVNIEIEENTEESHEKCDHVLVVNNYSTETETLQEMILEKEIEPEFDSIHLNSESEINIKVIEDKESLIENVEIEIPKSIDVEKMTVEENEVNDDNFQIETETKDKEIPDKEAETLTETTDKEAETSTEIPDKEAETLTVIPDKETSKPEIVESANPNFDIETETQLISEEEIKMSQVEENGNLAQKTPENKPNFELEQKLENPDPAAIIEKPSKVNKLRISSVKRDRAKLLSPRTSLRIKKSIRSTRRKSLSKIETSDKPILHRRNKSSPEKSNRVTTKTTTSKRNSLTTIENTKESKNEKQTDPDSKKSQNISKKLAKIGKAKKLEKLKTSASSGPNADADADKDAEVKSPIKNEKEPQNIKVKTPIKTPIKIKNVSDTATPTKKALQTEDKPKKNEICSTTVRRVSKRQTILKEDHIPIVNIDTDTDSPEASRKGLRKSGIKRKNALTMGELAKLEAESNKKRSKSKPIKLSATKTTAGTILTPEKDLIKKRKSEESQEKPGPESPAKKKPKISTTTTTEVSKMSIEIWDKSTRCSKCKIFYKTPVQALGCLSKHKKTRCWFCFDEISVDNLDKHLDKYHPNQFENDVYKCMFCENSYENYNALMVHIKKHKISEEK